MSTVNKKLKGLAPLPAPVPPTLAKAIGYTGDARYVAFNWTPYGDEVEYFDGRRSANGNWQAFLAYIQHPAVSPLLEDYNLGSSESEARHALILDRDKHDIMIAPVKETKKFLEAQWPPSNSRRSVKSRFPRALPPVFSLTSMPP